VTSQDETLNVRSRRELGSMPTTRTRTHPRDLIFAVKMGNDGAVRRLLKRYDAKIWTGLERSDEKGSTALMIAALDGHESIVRLLIEAGGDVTDEIPDDNGWTALMCAAYDGHESIVRLLIEGGSDVMGRDDNGWTVLMIAAQDGHESTVRLLIEAGSDVNAKNNSCYTALMIAAQNGHESTVRLLIEGGSDVNAKNNQCGTALMIAASNGHESTVRLLIEAGSDLRARDEDGVTALMLAASNGHESIVRLLMIKEARGVRHWLDTWLGIPGVQRKDINGQTALMSAARNGHESTFHALVEGGADDKVKFNGETAVQVLIEKVKGKQQNTDAAREHAQSVQQLIDEDAQRLPTGLYMKLCDANKRAYDS